MVSGRLTPKQRMLNAYRGIFSDRVAVAPEFWNYYPAKVLGVDMLTLQREIPLHRAWKQAFEAFGCEGWGTVNCARFAEGVEQTQQERWEDAETLEVRTTIHTPHGLLNRRVRFSRHETSGVVERPIKDLSRDLRAWEDCVFGEPEKADYSAAARAWEEVGQSYLLEAKLGTPFFDAYASSREGGIEAAVMDMVDNESLFEGLRQRYVEQMVRRARAVCQKTPFESLFVGCSWSCNSVIGPHMWRRWDKPVLQAVAREVHAHDRLLHIHFHGKCMEALEDLVEIAPDCICPFERPPGGDVAGMRGLRKVARTLAGKVAFNGNVHTVETLIRGGPGDVRREVGQVMWAFAGNPRLIVGTGDQVGAETPEENIWAMIDEARRLSPRWMSAADS